MTKPKTLDQLRAEKEQAEAFGEQKEVSGERRTHQAHPPPLQSGRHD